MPVPNVLLISADQWRAECLSALGHRHALTPNLDRLAADGVLFRNHYTTVAPCGPARTSLLTGLYAMNHRAVRNGTPLDARHTTLPLEARRAGYDPVLVGYTDTTPDPRGLDPADPALTDYGGVMPGFRVEMRYDDEFCRPWMQDLARRGYEVPADPLAVFQPAEPAPEGVGHSAPPTRYRAEHSDTAYTADRVLDVIARATRPWFVHAVFLRPHPPLYAPEPYNRCVNPDAVDPPLRRESVHTEAGQHPYLAQWLEQVATPGYLCGHPMNVRDLPAFEHRQLRATYYGLIREVDDQIGRLIDALKASGAYDNTLIVFTVDHGEQLGDHWLWGKGGYFDASYHIPLIVRDPRPQAQRGREVRAFTESVDLMPTILDWLGQAVPPACDGRSLLPWLRGESPGRWREAVHWEFDFREPSNPHVEQALGLAPEACTLNVLRTAEHKLVHFNGLPPLLFDLQRDPGELTDISREPSSQPVLLRMTQDLLSLRMRHAERTLTNIQITRDGPVTRHGQR